MAVHGGAVRSDILERAIGELASLEGCRWFGGLLESFRAAARAPQRDRRGAIEVARRLDEHRLWDLVRGWARLARLWEPILERIRPSLSLPVEGASRSSLGVWRPHTAVGYAFHITASIAEEWVAYLPVALEKACNATPLERNRLCTEVQRIAEYRLVSLRMALGHTRAAVALHDALVHRSGALADVWTRHDPPVPGARAVDRMIGQVVSVWDGISDWSDVPPAEEAVRRVRNIRTRLALIRANLQAVEAKRDQARRDVETAREALRACRRDAPPALWNDLRAVEQVVDGVVAHDPSAPRELDLQAARARGIATQAAAHERHTEHQEAVAARLRETAERLLRCPDVARSGTGGNLEAALTAAADGDDRAIADLQKALHVALNERTRGLLRHFAVLGGAVLACGEDLVAAAERWASWPNIDRPDPQHAAAGWAGYIRRAISEDSRLTLVRLFALHRLLSEASEQLPDDAAPVARFVGWLRTTYDTPGKWEPLPAGLGSIPPARPMGDMHRDLTSHGWDAAANKALRVLESAPRLWVAEWVERQWEEVKSTNRSVQRFRRQSDRVKARCDEVTGRGQPARLTRADRLLQLLRSGKLDNVGPDAPVWKELMEWVRVQRSFEPTVIEALRAIERSAASVDGSPSAVSWMASRFLALAAVVRDELPPEQIAPDLLGEPGEWAAFREEAAREAEGDQAGGEDESWTADEAASIIESLFERWGLELPPDPEARGLIAKRVVEAYKGRESFRRELGRYMKAQRELQDTGPDLRELGQAKIRVLARALGIEDWPVVIQLLSTA